MEGIGYRPTLLIFFFFLVSHLYTCSSLPTLYPVYTTYVLCSVIKPNSRYKGLKRKKKPHTINEITVEPVPDIVN